MPLIVIEPDPTTLEQAISALNDPNKGQDGEAQRNPMDEGFMLLGEYGEETPGDGDATGKVTFGAGESVGGGSAFEEEQGEEDENFGPDTGRVSCGVNTKGGEGREDDEEGCPSVVEGEGKVNEEFFPDRLSGVILLDDVIDVLRNMVASEIVLNRNF